MLQSTAISTGSRPVARTCVPSMPGTSVSSSRTLGTIGLVTLVTSRYGVGRFRRISCEPPCGERVPAAHRDGGGDALRVDVQVSVLVPDLLEDGQDAGEGVVGILLGTRGV